MRNFAKKFYIESSNFTSTAADLANPTIDDNLTTTFAASAKLSQARIRIFEFAINALASDTRVPLKLLK